MEHPHDEQLQRFARLEATRAENRAIVTHLLRGCPECGSKIREEINPPIPEEDLESALDRAIARCRLQMRSPDKPGHGSLPHVEG